MRKEVAIETLKSNPHFLQMIEEIAARPELLTRVEQGDTAAVMEASELAKEHFLMIALGCSHSAEAHQSLVSKMSHQVYSRIRNQ